jgi:hypothetical protein
VHSSKRTKKRQGLVDSFDIGQHEQIQTSIESSSYDEIAVMPVPSHG